MFERRLITKLVKQWKVENRLAVVEVQKLICPRHRIVYDSVLSLFANAFTHVK